MGFRVNVALLTFALLTPLTPTAQEVEPEVEYFFSARETITIGIMDIKGRGGVPQGQADVLGDCLAGEISRLGDLQVISQSDIYSMLDLEKQKRLAGCSDSECLSQAMNTFGFRWMVTGTLTLFGETYVLFLKLIDTHNSVVAGRVTRKIKGDADELLDDLPEVARELFDQVAESLGLSLPNRVTVAARHSQPIGRSPAAVTVITREDIATSGATRLADILRMVPGLEVLYVTSLYSSVTTRLVWGYSNNTLLVLIDGREVNLEMVGQAIWGLQPISLEEIERIEVIRGPGSSLYGANALAGVVSITTRKVTHRPSGWVRLVSGQRGTLQTNARVSSQVGKFGLSLSGGVEWSGSMVDPTTSRKEIFRFRTLTEYRFSDTQKILLDVGVAGGVGPLTTYVSEVMTESLLVPTRLAYHSDTLQTQLAWTYWGSDSDMVAPLEYAGIHLADFPPVQFRGHLTDGKIQWKLPRLWDPLLMIVGGRVRVAWCYVDRGLDAETFSDPQSPRYRKEGAEFLEVRAGTYLHLELAPVDWMTITAGTRLDYNTTSGVFVSPRLAGVFKPAAGQFFRLGVSRAFRMPSFFESALHLAVDFPVDSPFQTESEQNAFRDFATRILGNPEVGDETVLAFEAGYLGEYLDGQLALSLELYCNLFQDQIIVFTDILLDVNGLPDLRNSSVVFDNESDLDRTILGSELSVRYSPTESLSFMFAWVHRELFYTKTGDADDQSPKNMFILGGRFRTGMGILGSLYAFTRSEFRDVYVSNPKGIMESYLQQDMANFLMLIGRLGYRWTFRDDFEMEAGVKLLLPVSFRPPYFRYQEKGGGETLYGRRYGADELRRVVTAYLQGSF